jgi:hypothetical protein
LGRFKIKYQITSSTKAIPAAAAVSPATAVSAATSAISVRINKSLLSLTPAQENKRELLEIICGPVTASISPATTTVATATATATMVPAHAGETRRIN